MKILKRLYVVSKENKQNTLSFGAIIEMDNGIQNWYPSKKLTGDEAKYVIDNKDEFYFNTFDVPEEEQEVPTKGTIKTTTTTTKESKSPFAGRPATKTTTKKMAVEWGSDAAE